MTSGLRRFQQPPVRPAAGERCELCDEPIGADHRHVVNVDSRELRCACTGCYLLFTHPGAGRYRAVPDRYRYAAPLRAARQFWDSAGIPVGTAFFFTNSAQARTVGFYPSPAGATESLLSMDAWADLLRDNPELADFADDTEALLVRQVADGFEGYLVPIDACYRLVGLVRMYWKGFDGGSEARQAIDEFFAELRDRTGGPVSAGG